VGQGDAWSAAEGGGMTGMELHCDTCARQWISERPAGADRPPATRSDRACAACGAAIGIAPVILLMDRRSRVILRRKAA
jgi:hypothetical protein